MQKNQNDLIFSIVFAVLGCIAVGVAFATKPEVPPIAAPPVIVTKDAELPPTAVVYGNALPAGTATAGGGAGGFGGGRGGSPYGGPPGGFGGASGRPPSGPPGGAPGGGMTPSIAGPSRGG